MSSTPTQVAGPLGSTVTDWRERLQAVVETMREMSTHTDPQEMVRAYGARMRQLYRNDGFLSLSRRGLKAPYYRITRHARWAGKINPWTEKERLPLLQGGLLGELIYGDQPRIIDEIELQPGDPSAPHLEGYRSLMALPNYDGGHALNMTVRLSHEPAAFDPEILPEHLWTSNLFGRATQNLVLNDELKRAYEIVDRELTRVAEIQRSLLPKELPKIPGFDLAAHYQTSQWAGGDYYDFFPLPEGRWGILIADVSGHGTPAAVMMAITHSIAHAYPGVPDPPGKVLGFVNDRLAGHYTTDNESFVTAFYGIYDSKTRELTYACAGHNPPRLKRCVDGSVISLDGVGGLPLGILATGPYPEKTVQFVPGDQVVFYTDGITEANDPEGHMFGMERLDEVLENCYLDAAGLANEVLVALERFTAGQPAADDRTLLIGKVS